MVDGINGGAGKVPEWKNNPTEKQNVSANSGETKQSSIFKDSNLHKLDDIDPKAMSEHLAKFQEKERQSFEARFPDLKYTDWEPLNGPGWTVKTPERGGKLKEGVSPSVALNNDGTLKEGWSISEDGSLNYKTPIRGFNEAIENRFGVSTEQPVYKVQDGKLVKVGVKPKSTAGKEQGSASFQDSSGKPIKLISFADIIARIRDFNLNFGWLEK